jgi:hypothetical protein
MLGCAPIYGVSSIYVYSTVSLLHDAKRLNHTGADVTIPGSHPSLQLPWNPISGQHSEPTLRPDSLCCPFHALPRHQRASGARGDIWKKQQNLEIFKVMAPVMWRNRVAMNFIRKLYWDSVLRICLYCKMFTKDWKKSRLGLWGTILLTCLLYFREPVLRPLIEAPAGDARTGRRLSSCREDVDLES